MEIPENIKNKKSIDALKDKRVTECKLQNSYQELPKRFYRKAETANFPDPKLAIWNSELSKELGLEQIVERWTEQEKARIFCGNCFPEGSTPISQAYGGHQFGYFNILGDGRAILLGEQTAPNGQIFDIQLKGSGMTAYSRGGDGKAVIGPMLREYLISEAMHALRVPTTRSLAVTLTGENVFRNEFQPGAVLTRVASSHLRVGTFQFAALGGKEQIKALADYAIHRHYPELRTMAETGEDNKYQKLLEMVVQKQAKLIAQWQLLGFIHGVMNTDNMTISGETIDYGPCAFLDTYDPKTVYSSIDYSGRYRFENQPPIGQWNLSRLADALLPILDEDESRATAYATTALVQYGEWFHDFWLAGMKKKLGIQKESRIDEALIADFLTFMEKRGADYTNTFVRLTLEADGQDGSYLQGTAALFSDFNFQKWKDLWQDRIRLHETDRQETVKQMKQANPFLIPRNFHVESALSKAQKGDMAL